MKSLNPFLFVFYFLLITDIFGSSFEELYFIRFFSKPLLTVALVLYFWNSKSGFKKSNWIYFALIFSFLGDVFLLFEERLFLPGLFAFFTAHVMYIVSFSKPQNFTLKKMSFISIVLILYAIPILYLILPNAGNLMPYIILYVAILMIMAITMYLRKNTTNKVSFQLVFFGACLFLISDSILAINKFAFEIAFANIWIMLTYGVAQYMIIKGAIKNQDK